MTTMRDDQDLERLLRDTLAARADTIERGPAWLGGATAPARRRPLLAPLVAAAVVIAIAVTIAVVRASTRTVAPADPTPTQSLAAPSPSASPTPSPSPILRTGSVTLSWLQSAIPSGYVERDRSITADFTMEQLIKRDDPQAPPTGGAPHGIVVRWWSRGGFDPNTVHGQSVRIGTDAARFGTAPAGMFDWVVPLAHGTVPTLAVQFAPGRWLTLAGGTAETSTLAELSRVATTVLGHREPLAARVPLRLSGLPATWRVTGADEDLDPTHPYGLTIWLSDGRTDDDQNNMIEITIWQQNSVPYNPTGAHIRVGGRTGVLDPSGQEIAFPIGKRLVSVSYDGPKASPTALRALLGGVTWASDPTTGSTWFDGTSLLR